MNSSRKFDWNCIGKIYMFSSRRVFEEIRPPSNHIWVPLLYVAITSALIAWIIVPIIATGVGIEREIKPGLWVAHRLSETDATRLVDYVVFHAPYAVFEFVLSVILLGTYFFVVARCFRIDEIRWEHWFGFACWTLVPLILVDGAAIFIDAYSEARDPLLSISVFVVAVCFLLPIVWTVILTAQGLRIWTAKGWGFCLGFSVLPYTMFVLIYIQDIVAMFMRAAS